MLLLLVLVFVALALVNTPIVFALGIAVAMVAVVGGSVPLEAIPHKMVNMLDSYVFLAIPMFLLAGRLMNEGGITQRLFQFARVLVGSITGGLAHATVVTGVVFAWMTGSAVAAVGALGELNLKAFKANGYDSGFASSVTVSASVLGPILPPSIPLIIYAAMSENSVGSLFLGAIIPGLLLALALMVLIFILSRARQYPRDPWAGWIQVGIAFREAMIPLCLPLIMLGGIASGVFTPTESAAVAAAYALLITLFHYRSIRLSELPGILVETMVATAVITFIISMTSSFSFILAIEDAGPKVLQIVTGFTENPYAVLLLINVVLLVFGALMEAGVVLILFIPIFYPLAMSLGIDPIHFGVVMVMNLMIGVATPPMGVSLFMMSHISGLRVEVIMRQILVFLIPMIATLLLVTYVPATVTWLPSLFD